MADPEVPLTFHLHFREVSGCREEALGSGSREVDLAPRRPTNRPWSACGTGYCPQARDRDHPRWLGVPSPTLGVTKLVDESWSAEVKGFPYSTSGKVKGNHYSRFDVAAPTMAL